MTARASLLQLHRALNRLSAIPDDQWSALQELLREKFVQKGETFVEIGDRTGEMGFVVSGLLRKYYLNEEGQEFIKGFSWENEIASPYASLITGQPSNIHIEALEDTHLRVIRYADFQKLYPKHSCWQEIGRKLAEKCFIEREQREFEFLTLSAQERYARFKKGFPFLIGRVSQYHIASYLGITPVALSRIINGKTARKAK